MVSLFFPIFCLFVGYEFDIFADKAWPIAKQSTGNTVFVNPNFIPKDKKADKKKGSSKVESDQSEDEEDEETKRLKEQMKELKRKKREIEKAKMLKEFGELKRQVAKVPKLI